MPKDAHVLAILSQHSFGAALGAALAWGGRGGLGGIVLAEEDVVGGVGVEGGIEVDEVYGLSLGMLLTEDGEVVSEVEFVGVGVVLCGGGHGESPSIRPDLRMR